MSATVQKSPVNIARECLVLFQDARRAAVVDGVSFNPSDSTGLAHCFDRYDQFKSDGGEVLWDVLMRLPSARFDIPLHFDCDIRYHTTLTGSELLRRLEAFRDELSELPAFYSGCRKVYKNWAIRAALRCGYALSHEKEFRDVLIVAGDDLPENAPAVFDPATLEVLECMYPNGSDDGDTIDPEMFDRARKAADAAGIF